MVFSIEEKMGFEFVVVLLFVSRVASISIDGQLVQAKKGNIWNFFFFEFSRSVICVWFCFLLSSFVLLKFTLFMIFMCNWHENFSIDGIVFVLIYCKRFSFLCAILMNFSRYIKNLFINIFIFSFYFLL